MLVGVALLLAALLVSAGLPASLGSATGLPGPAVPVASEHSSAVDVGGRGSNASALAYVSDCYQFIADVTVPDGTPVQPGEQIDKVWRVLNCGNTAWSGYRAVRIDGEYGPSSFDVPSTEPGQTADLRARMAASTAPGCHRAVYQLEGPNGRFGRPFFAEILVTGPGSRTPARFFMWRDLEPALVPPADLGANWSMFYVEPFEGAGCTTGPAYLATYSNNVDYPDDGPRGRIALFSVLVLYTESAADAQLFQDAQRDPASEPAEGLGDGPAYRFWTHPEGVDSEGYAGYGFRVGTTVVRTGVRAKQTLPESLDEQAQQFARLQQDGVRALLEAAPGPASPASPPTYQPRPAVMPPPVSGSTPSGPLRVPGDPPVVGEVIVKDPLRTPRVLPGSDACPSGRNLGAFVDEGYLLKIAGRCQDDSMYTGIDVTIPDLVVHNGEIRLDAKVVSGHDRAFVSVLFAQSIDPPTGYMVQMVPARGLASLSKAEAYVRRHRYSTVERRADLRELMSPNDWNDIAVRRDGPNFWILVNGELILSASDPSFDGGGVAFALYRGGNTDDDAETAVILRNLRISRLAPRPQ
jgi:hypothetical protein